MSHPHTSYDDDHDDESLRIHGLVETYIEGARTGGTDQMQSIFHETATICGYVGPDLFAGPIQMFFDWHAENGAAPGVEGRATRIDIQGPAATARIEIDDWTGHRFTDFFTLVRIDGPWQVLSKVFYLHPPHDQESGAGIPG
jgi:hypothetical protein